ncbi:MAG: hypothetical protein BGO55_21130 [Sphingobacteriales bacterium 50-39]|nr:MAG: hypothetical protein BGO55_21130 [Sphingobacteriales bacterium 50-39]
MIPLQGRIHGKRFHKKEVAQTLVIENFMDIIRTHIIRVQGTANFMISNRNKGQSPLLHGRNGTVSSFKT